MGDVSSIVISELEYAPPGADQLFFDVSFGVAPGEHAALVGANGVGKSTILRVPALSFFVCYIKPCFFVYFSVLSPYPQSIYDILPRRDPKFVKH